MYGEPALPEGFAHLPQANPDAPQGGRIVMGEVGSYDSLNPHILRGTPPWALRFLASESLLGRSYDEPFSLYGLLAESVETPPDRSWVEFTLRPEATFSDGTPVTVEDVIWSLQTLGTEGHPRYRGVWAKVGGIGQTGERKVRITFNEPDPEMPLIMGMRPILKKAQWQDTAFTESGLDEIPISSAPYVVTDFEAGRSVTLERDPDYWGNDLPFMAGQANLDEIRMEFFGDSAVMFEAFKSGALDTYRETSAENWARRYDFPAMRSGEMVQEEIPHQRPSGISGFVMNTREAPFDDWRVREAMIQAFNYEFINQVLNGGGLPRITSYFSNSVLGMEEGPAEGQVAEYLDAYASHLPPDAMEGYTLPVSDGSERNRSGLRRARMLLNEAGWEVGDGGRLRNAEGAPFDFEILLDQGGLEPHAAQQAADLFAAALERLGISPMISLVDSAQYRQRTQNFDFDMTWYMRGLTLSPGNEQYYYWGSDAADEPGSYNWMGIESPAVDGLIGDMLTAPDDASFVAATQALDRVLTAGRYVIPVWYNPVSYLAYNSDLAHPETVPIYGDWFTWQPDFWWSNES